MLVWFLFNQLVVVWFPFSSHTALTFSLTFSPCTYLFQDQRYLQINLIVLGMGGDMNSCQIVLSSSSMDTKLEPKGAERNTSKCCYMVPLSAQFLFTCLDAVSRPVHLFSTLKILMMRSIQNLNLIDLMNRWRMKRYRRLSRSRRLSRYRKLCRYRMLTRSRRPRRCRGPRRCQKAQKPNNQANVCKAATRSHTCVWWPPLAWVDFTTFLHEFNLCISHW